MFIFDCAGSSLLQGIFSNCGKWGLLSNHVAQAFYYSNFSCCGAWALGHAVFSRCGSWALEHKLNSCGTWAYLLQGMWDLPRPGIEHMSFALAGRFFITREALYLFLYIYIYSGKEEIIKILFELLNVAI